MLPIRLELRNFLPYRAPDALRFEGIHLACLTGPNGAGKSSLLDAFTWVLWGKARAKRDDDLVHLGQQEMFVQLDFEQEGIVYRVLRRRRRGKTTSGELHLFSIESDGKLNTLNEPSMRDTQEKINRLLRLDYETFVNSAYLQQGKADAFTTRTPAQRKQILADILGLDQWERYEETVKERLKQIEIQYAVIENNIKEIDVALAQEHTLKQMVQEAEQAYAEAEKTVTAAEARADALKASEANLYNARDQLRDVKQRIAEYEREIHESQSSIEREEKQIAAYEPVVALREEIEAGYDALQAARETDQALGAKLSELKSLDEQRLELQGDLKAERTRLEGEIARLEGRMSDAQKVIAVADSAELENVLVEVSSLRTLEAERDQLTEQESVLREQRAALEAALKTLEEEGKEQRERQQKLSAAEGATCPLCGQPLTEDHRQQLLDELNVQIETMRGQYRQTREDIGTVAETLKNNTARIKTLANELKRLPLLLEQVGNLRTQADAASDAAARLAEDAARLEQVRLLLAEESYGAEIRQQIALLDERIRELGYDSASHSAARGELEAYREFEKRKTQLELALENLPAARERLKEAQARKARYAAALVTEQEAAQKWDVEIARLEVLVHEYQERVAEANHYRSLAQAARDRMTNARQELMALDALRARKTQLLRQQDLLRHDEGLYKDLKMAFSKNGIPAMIIETAIPELEAIANRLLSSMTDGRMHLKLNTQREKVTGGVAETLDIEIADELGTRNYEMYSGGEAFRIDFALRVALSQLLARRAGAHLRTLFIDEGFGSQDEAGRNKLVEAITAIQHEFDLILVITHIEELRDNFPVHILVDKTANGSRIAVR